MAEVNRDEADKCKQIAQAALRSGDSDKAVRFLTKAKRMCPGDTSIDALLEVAQNGGGGEERPRASTSEEPGLRQRSSTTSSSAPQRPSAAGGDRMNKDGQKYTADQAKDVQRILRTKDFYEVLGIERNSPKEVVNKAYKKMALKLHPDKNKAPGAEEAFKKVSKAVQCLSDEEKRNAYNRYGDEDQVPQHQRHYQQDFVSPEDFFAAFFGGGFSGQPQRRQSQHQHQQQDGEGAQRAHLLQMLPVILLVLLTLASNLASRDSGSRFSFSASGAYQNERTTASIGVNYYVANDFDDHYPDGTRVLGDFEKQVEIYYVRNLHSECDYQEKVMYKKVMIAKRRSSQEELQKARNHPRPACKEIEKVKKRHNDIYRQAIYMPY